MNATVVFVDDDPAMRESVKRITRREPYRVLTANSAQQCVELLAVTDVEVLVSDLSMPGFNGVSLIHYFKNEQPDVVRIVLSGALDLATTLELVNVGQVFRCLEKPSSSEILKSTIRDALNFRKVLCAHRARISNSNLGRVETKRCEHELTSLVSDAVKNVEQLENALAQQSGRGRPICRK